MGYKRKEYENMESLFTNGKKKFVKYEEGRRNLAAHDNMVDFIVTHCCSSSTQVLLGGGLYKPDILTKYLEEIRQTVKFKKWFFGHYHDNKNVNAEELLLYEQIIRIR